MKVEKIEFEMPTQTEILIISNDLISKEIYYSKQDQKIF
jgi:hypothetical protein